MINIKNNILSQEELHCLQQTLYSDRFNWVEAQTNRPKLDDQGGFDPWKLALNNSYLVHEFRHVNGIASPYDFLIHPLLDVLQPKAIMRVKANKYVQTPTLEQHEYHQDFPFQHKAAIFYVNTNNGQTQFVDTAVDSVENSMLLFDASVEHRSTTTTDAPYRININFNYF